VDAIKNLGGDIIGRLQFSTEHSIKQDQLAARAVNFPSRGFVNRAVFIAVTATDALIERKLPFFYFGDVSH
jgi:hypothetical protein